jgi:hypothetical protein
MGKPLRGAGIELTFRCSGREQWSDPERAPALWVRVEGERRGAAC